MLLITKLPKYVSFEVFVPNAALMGLSLYPDTLGHNAAHRYELVVTLRNARLLLECKIFTIMLPFHRLRMY